MRRAPEDTNGTSTAAGRLVARVAAVSAMTGLVALMTAGPAVAQAGALAALGSPPDPKVPVSWDRYYDHAAVEDIGRRLEEAYPDRCRFGSIGKSYEGRDIWLLTVTNFRVGEADRKPAMYIDGNIHSNEIQGQEIALYTAWYLCEMADRVPWVSDLLDDRTMYIVPTINPDGRAAFIDSPNTPSSPRSGVAPRDDDGDGLFDEDDLDDLNGDGHITMMRRRDPNGRWLVSREDPRLMIRARPDEPGEYEILGYEGFDNDNDGRVNEDRTGYYDPNRNWPWLWQPQYVQSGADAYPASLPETRAVIDFVLDHENIAGAQTYHNSGGMILRGPGQAQDVVRPSDVRVYDRIGEIGETILPGYRYMVLWSDLYPVWGGELDWFYGARGILTFSNELWTSYNYFRTERGDEPPDRHERADYRFDRLLLFGEAVVPWTPVEHPTYGPIEVGGVKKQYTRAIPGFMLAEEAHRNMAFTLFQAHQLPLAKVDSIAVRPIGQGLSEVTAIVANKRLAPTHTQQDQDHRISRPDWISLEGGDVVAGFVVTDPLQDLAVEQERRPARIEVESIPGMGTVTVRWIVRGSGPFTVTVDSPKGGVHSLSR